MIISRGIAIFFVLVILAILIAGVIDSDIGDQELLQSHDLPAGYFIFGQYTDYRDGGEALCFHDFEACIFQR